MDAVAPQPQSGPAPRYLYIVPVCYELTMYCNIQSSGKFRGRLQAQRDSGAPQVGILAQPLRPLCEGVA